jgi:hypothetical protein
VKSISRIALAVAALQLLAASAAAGHNARAVASVVAAAGGCSPAAVTPRVFKSAPTSQAARRRAGRRRADALQPGVWGGDHIRLVVTDDGATVEFDCAQATVEGRIVVDRAGRFSAAGTYLQEHGGPVRDDESSAGVPARFTGRVGGSLMKLTITRVGAGRAIGTYELARGREPRIFKCR